MHNEEIFTQTTWVIANLVRGQPLPPY